MASAVLELLDQPCLKLTALLTKIFPLVHKLACIRFSVVCTRTNQEALALSGKDIIPASRRNWTKGLGQEDSPMRSRKERLMKRLAAQLKLLQKAKALPRISAG